MCILLARLSLAEIREHLQSKAYRSTDSSADVIAARANELCNGLASNDRVARILNVRPLSGQPVTEFLLRLFSLPFSSHV